MIDKIGGERTAGIDAAVRCQLGWRGVDGWRNETEKERRPGPEGSSPRGGVRPEESWRADISRLALGGGAVFQTLHAMKLFIQRMAEGGTEGSDQRAAPMSHQPPSSEGGGWTVRLWRVRRGGGVLAASAGAPGSVRSTRRISPGRPSAASAWAVGGEGGDGPTEAPGACHGTLRQGLS